MNGKYLSLLFKLSHSSSKADIANQSPYSFMPSKTGWILIIPLKTRLTCEIKLTCQQIYMMLKCYLTKSWFHKHPSNAKVAMLGQNVFPMSCLHPSQVTWPSTDLSLSWSQSLSFFLVARKLIAWTLIIFNGKHDYTMSYRVK